MTWWRPRNRPRAIGCSSRGRHQVMPCRSGLGRRAAEGVGGRKSAVEKARARAYFCRAQRALAMI